MIFKVKVYEPACDPGGYTEDFEIEACCELKAKKLALEEMRKKHPGNGLWFSVASIDETSHN